MTDLSNSNLEKLLAEATKGPWKPEIGFGSPRVMARDVKGEFPICDIRGWGHLTGKGHGALGLSPDEGAKIQDANASLIALTPDLAAEVIRLRKALEFFVGGGQENVLQDILWKDAPDDATIKITLAVGKFRQARAALDHKDHSS